MNLEKTVEKARGGLRKIQRFDEKKKKRYLVVLSFLAMIVVVGLWFSYLQVTLPHPASVETENIPAETAAEKNENSFFRTIGRGAKNILDGLKNQFAEFKTNLSQVKEFSIEGGGTDFSSNDEPVKPTPLP
ncbi:MAG: hypothetical protein V2A55_02140 [Candidatus Jorgensenbacteria bacterium]